MKTRRLPALLTLVPVLVAVLVACGSEESGGGLKAGDETTATSTASASDDDAGEPGDDVCSLVTVAEVSKAVGTEVTDPVATHTDGVVTGGSQATCVWAGADNGAATATFTLYTDASAADSVKDADSLPLPEVGNDAFIGSFASVWAYAGDGSFMVQWYDFSASDDENLPKSIALAQLVLDRI